MSRSQPNKNIPISDKPYYEPEKKYWIGYNDKSLRPSLQRQSKYSTDWMYKDSPECLEDLGDYHYTRYDMDYDLDKDDNDYKEIK
jgi:hypothetical protein